MGDYSKGKIYRVICKCGCDQVYIGSTRQTLCRRLNKHRADFNSFKKGRTRQDGKPVSNISVFQIMDHNDYDIFLIENYPCNNKEELRSRERYWVETNMCINIKCPIRSKEEKKEVMKNYYQENRERMKEQRNLNSKRYNERHPEKVKERKRKYRERNKDKIQEYNKLYREQNQDKITERTKRYYEENPDKLKNRREKHNEYSKQKTECECGSAITKGGLSRHKESKKHTDYVNKQNSN